MTPEEISTWSAEDVRTKIREMLPTDWKFDCILSSGFWVGRVRNEHGSVAAEFTGADHRLVLLDIFGWVWLKGQSVSKDSPWYREEHEDRQVQAVFIHGSAVPDPEDLNPDEIAKLIRGD